ncbi:MAG: hypothetical protein COA81_04280 [Alphaproteobacteria bacterium]|nr:MAG: hypothetical protein COA81_04280 [Alphaproteobacteria bacterium]
MAVASNGAKDVKKIQDQPYGEYLAGLHAAINNDVSAAADFHAQALVLDPENSMILRKSFILFVIDGRYEQALKVAHKLDDLNISDSMVKMFLFLEKMKARDYEASLSKLDNIGNAGVYGLFKPLFKSWILVAQGKTELAEANMIKLLENKSFMSFKQFHAALFYDYIGKTQLAEQMYAKSLVDMGAMTLRTAEAYGILLRRLARDKDAHQLYVNYLEKAPDNAILKRALKDMENGVRAKSYISSEHDALAEIFYTAGNFLIQDNIRRPAAAYLRFAGYMKKDFYNADYLLGQIFEADKYYDGALKQFSRIDKKYPLYFKAQLQIAWVLEKMGELDQSIAAMEKLSRDFPENREVLASLGDINRMNSRFEEAGKAYSKYINSLSEVKAKDWSIFYTRGIVYEQAKKWKLAEADFLKALELRPDQPQVLNYLAYSWVDKGINIDKARKMLERAVELRPYDGYIIDSLGWALYRIGDMPKAVEYLEKAVLLQTDDWAINDHLGDAYWAVGRKYEARFQWRHALSLKPDEKLVTEIRTKIRDGKKKP